MDQAAPPFEEGQEIDLDVHALAQEGLGIGRREGVVVFVPFAAPGDRVRARVTRVRSRYVEAELVQVLAPSPSRVDPPCPAFARCGGCALQHLRYDEQLEWKRRWVQDSLERIGRLRGVAVSPTLAAEPPWSYRNKATIPLRRRQGRIEAGFFAPRSHELVPFPEAGCAIQHPRIDAVVAAAAEWLDGPGRAVEAYDPATGRGLLRHLVVRVGFRTGEVLAGVVVHGREFPGEREFAAHLAARVPGLVGVVKNVNTQWINAVLGPRTETLHGRPYLIDELAGLRFRISLASFFQVNPRQTERLYEIALAAAAPSGDEWVIDAYSGTGTLALLAARRLGRGGRVTAVEILPQAVADARDNARLNGIEGVEFIVGAAERVLPTLAARAAGRPATVILDPPRKGCAEDVLEACLRLRPERIVYISCNPATLARDLGRLCGTGAYRVDAVQPVDMFPHTAHVEVVAAVRRAG